MNIYLDNAATTKIDEKVLSLLNKSLREDWGNPSSLYKKGKEAKEKIENARKVIAKTLNAKPKEIIFTSGATESNTLAIRGILGVSRKKEILISAMEHASIKNLCHELQKEKYIVHKIPVNKKGEINIKVLKEKLTKNIALVSMIHANNETGGIQDIQKIADLCAQKNIPFHTDAVQSYKKIPLDLEKMKCTALSISAHK
ncbi:MAG TPA: aminotransferase class V-fold PLP-dependent enzyme, partial [Nanoarchaeota archaeon]|nr:aminotransferase class V-fold PLP-dependent enzyme [Nanoarchaeota archaeon]